MPSWLSWRFPAGTMSAHWLISPRSNPLISPASAGINEGARLDGADVHFAPEEIGALVDISIMAEFIGIFTRQTQAKGATDDGKKK